MEDEKNLNTPQEQPQSGGGAGAEKHKVEMYTTPQCHFCQKTKAFFKENNVEYTEYDVAADAMKRQEMIEKSGQMGVPVIFIDDQMVIGFNEARLRELLGIT